MVDFLPIIIYHHRYGAFCLLRTASLFWSADAGTLGKLLVPASPDSGTKVGGEVCGLATVKVEAGAAATAAQLSLTGVAGGGFDSAAGSASSDTRDVNADTEDSVSCRRDSVSRMGAFMKPRTPIKIMLSMV